MNCHSARPLLHVLVDGTLPPARQRPLRAHLKSCPACTQELRELERTFALLDTLGSIQPQAGFAGQLAERLDVERGVSCPSWARPFGRSLLALAGIAGLSMVLMSLDDAWAEVAESDAGSALVETMDELLSLVSLDGVLNDPTELAETVFQGAILAGTTFGGLFLLGATLVLIACSAALYGLLSANRPARRGLRSQALRR